MTKNIIAAIFICSIVTTFAQTLNYNDLGTLYARNNNFGTARFEAMSGAFGALGGDLSSININPAGIAVTQRGGSSISLGVHSLSSDTKFYENNNHYQDSYLNLAQAGGALIFYLQSDTEHRKRYAITLNYSKKADFSGVYSGKNDNIINNNPHFTEILNKQDPKYYKNFDRSIYQEIKTNIEGKSSVFNVGFAINYDTKLQVGGSLNFHKFSSTERTVYYEDVDDVDENILCSKFSQESDIEARAFSLNLGVIYRIKNLRLGLAYETPTWYGDIVEDYSDNYSIEPKDENLKIKDWSSEINTAAYSFRAPSKLTLSTAYVFKKQGLISIDYSFRNYKNMKYRNPDEILSEANNDFNNNFQPTHNVNIGTEWRIKALSLRGGYQFSQSPNKTNSDLKGFSLGAGYNFGNRRIDLSYQNNNEKTNYNIYNTNGIEVDNNNSRITATLTFGL